MEKAVFSLLADDLTLKCVRECVGFLSACGLCVSDYLYNARMLKLKPPGTQSNTCVESCYRCACC